MIDPHRASLDLGAIERGKARRHPWTAIGQVLIAAAMHPDQDKGRIIPGRGREKPLGHVDRAGGEQIEPCGNAHVP